jgi:hypothetical protein
MNQLFDFQVPNIVAATRAPVSNTESSAPMDQIPKSQESAPGRNMTNVDVIAATFSVQQIKRLRDRR